MSRPRNPHPKLVRDKARDWAVCWFTDPASGKRRGVRLGRWGSVEAEERYKRLLADIRAGTPRPARPAGGVTVAELCLRFARHAGSYYGPTSSEYAHYKPVLATLADAEGDAPAASFGPAALKRVRESFIRLGWQRQYVNDQVRRVRTVFKWAVSEELVGSEVWTALRSVPGLARGRSAAPEREPVGPAPLRAVAAALRRMPPAVRTMVRFQWLTGCRCQDVCNLEVGAIDRGGEVWVYTPRTHKGGWRGKVRRVFVGPKAQRLLAPVLPDSGHVFPTRRGRYSSMTYCRAVLRACRKAGVPEWSPGQLRHSAGTRFRRLFGLETARVLLGHDRTSTTELYAEKPAQVAADAMRRVG